MEIKICRQREEINNLNQALKKTEVETVDKLKKAKGEIKTRICTRTYRKE